MVADADKLGISVWFPTSRCVGLAVIYLCKEELNGRCGVPRVLHFVPIIRECGGVDASVVGVEVLDERAHCDYCESGGTILEGGKGGLVHRV